MFDVPSEWSLPPVKVADVVSSKKKRKPSPKSITIDDRKGEKKSAPTTIPKHRHEQPVQVKKPTARHTDQKFIQSKTRLSVADKSNDLSGARFRYLNEKLYTMDSTSAVAHFTENPKDFERYHEGFANQVAAWPANPVDIFIERLQKLVKRGSGKKLSVVDLGCGEGKLGMACKDAHFVRSFDLVALHPHIEVGDMCNLPMIESQSVDIVIFCLSLMNTNFVDALKEAHRILKPNGRLWIAEVASRFSDGPASFARGIGQSFKQVTVNTNNPVFVLFEFAKISTGMNNRIDATLAPCLYKKR